MQLQLKNNIKLRVFGLLAVIFLLFCLITWRLFFIQIKQHSFYSALAAEQHKELDLKFLNRGEIRTSDGYILAMNKKWPLVYAVPKKIKDPSHTANQLAPILDIDEEIIKKRLSKPNDPYEPLKHKLSDETANQIQALRLEGIAIDYEWSRYYPANNLASHIIGFIGDQAGQYGLEKQYDNELNQGENLVLTLDYVVQFFAEQELKALVENFKAKSGSIIIMDPQTGALIALANNPNFDPNNYSEVQNIEVYLNSSLSHIFEPGSVFKPITMAAALDSGKITPETTYFDSGERIISDYVIHNWDLKSYGKQTMTQVLEKSLNTGAIFAMEKAGKQAFLQYVRDFGFGFPTGIDLPNEQSGDLSNLLTSKRDINYATASYGQGISCTPLQLITAIGAVANNGRLVQPQIIAGKSQVVKQVIFSQTAWQLTEMLKSVFASGNLKNALVQGYEIAGKTGTAQIPEKGGYSSSRAIHTLVGYAPANNPKFIILLKLDEPQGTRWSAVSLPPTFHNIVQFLLNYYQIPPSK